VPVSRGFGGAACEKRRTPVYLGSMRLVGGAGLVTAVIAAVVGCGGRSREPGNEAAAGSGGMSRVPAQHRPSAAPDCPVERGSNEPLPPPACSDSSTIECEHDRDCVEGNAGRCQRSRFPCLVQCSYDQCTNDADCARNKPCECRSAPGDTGPNRCLEASSCRVDADCGPGGYCSPSLLATFCVCTSVDYCKTLGDTATCSPGACSCGDSCGHGYFCHTPSDSCLDDADCSGGTTCNFDLAHLNWICSGCWPVP
jgi:hypothetical protein